MRFKSIPATTGLVDQFAPIAIDWSNGRFRAQPLNTAELELYDYQTDPLETRNLAADKPEVTGQLLQLLAQHPEAKPQIKVDKSQATPSQNPLTTLIEMHCSINE